MTYCYRHTTMVLTRDPRRVNQGPHLEDRKGCGAVMQELQECRDTAVVRAWLQANVPGLDLAPAVQVEAAQDEVLGGAGSHLSLRCDRTYLIAA